MELLKPRSRFSLSRLFHRDKLSVFDWLIRLSVYLIVILVPTFFLTVTQSFFDLNKIYIFCLLTLIGVLAWLAKIIFRKGFNFRRTFLDIPLVVFGLLYILVTLLSKNWYISLAGLTNYYHHTLVSILFFILFYFLVVNNFRTRSEIRGLLITFIAVAGLVSLFSLFQMLGVYIFTLPATQSSSFNLIFNSVTILGLFLAIILPAILSFLILIKDIRYRLLLALAGLVDFVVLVLIDQNLVWYFLIGGLFLYLIFLTLRSRQSEARWTILPTVILVLAAVFLFVNVSNLTDLQLPSDLVLDHQTTWQISRSTLSSEPMFGLGPEMFFRSLTLHRPLEFNNQATWNLNFIKGSSEFLQILITNGLLVALIFIFILIRFTLKFIRGFVKEIKGDESWFLYAALFLPWLALLVVFFLYPFSFVLFFSFWLFLTLGASWLTRDKGEVLETQPSTTVGFMSSIVFSMLIVLGIVFVYGAGTVWLADYHYVKGSRAISNNDFTVAQKEFNRATQLNQHESLYHFALAQAFLTEASSLADSQQAEAANRLNELVTLIQVATTNGLNTDRAEPLNYQAVINIYSSLNGLVPNVNSEIADLCDQLIDLDSNNPAVYVSAGDNSVAIATTLLAQVESATEETKKQIQDQASQAYTKAMEYYKKAGQIKNNYLTADLKRALVYELMGNANQAITELEGMESKYNDQVDWLYELGRLYYANNKKDLAKEKFVKVLNISPNHANAAYLLGEIVEQEGDKATAIQLFSLVLQNNPDNQQVRQKLESLGVTIEDNREKTTE